MKISIYDEQGEYLGVVSLSDEDFINVREYAESRNEEVTNVLLSLISEGIGGQEE